MTVKRHAEWSALTVKLCRQCLQEHVQQYVIRYPVQAFGQETCECPCQCTGTGITELPAVGSSKRKSQRKPGARVRPAKSGELFTA